MTLEKNTTNTMSDIKIKQEATDEGLKEPGDTLGRPILPQTDTEKGLVGWDGQDDPTMPMNFPRSKKWTLLGLIAAMNFLSPLTSTLPAPGVSEMNIDFHNTNSLLTTFVIPVFVLGMRFFLS